MAVFKPGNLPMHENGAYRKNTFATLLGNLCGKDWSAVHRLDRETSGIVLCSSKPAIRQALADMFEAKTIQKEYLLIAAGVPKEQSWSCQGPLGDLVESQIRIKKWVVEGGLPSSTDFILEETCHDEFSLIRAFPRTGRTNQIRIHAAYSGHWILGDKLYNPDERVFLDYWENGTTTPLCIEKTHFHRLCLHAASLTFTHPETRKNIEITSPLPEDLQDLWYSLGRSRYTENAQ